MVQQTNFNEMEIHLRPSYPSKLKAVSIAAAAEAAISLFQFQLTKMTSRHAYLTCM